MFIWSLNLINFRKLDSKSHSWRTLYLERHTKYFIFYLDWVFFDILGVRIPPKVRAKFSRSRRYIPLMSGDKADSGDSATFIDLFCPEIDKNDAIAHGIYRSLFEALANAVEHAYPDDTYLGKSSEQKKWWLAGAIDYESNVRRIILLDHGISIPGSLPFTSTGQKILQNIKQLVGIYGHGQQIAAAMEYGRSRTSAPQRGKGLQDVIALADLNQRNELIIMSARGVYRYCNKSYSTEDFNDVVRGTIIEWRLSFDGHTGSVL